MLKHFVYVYHFSLKRGTCPCQSFLLNVPQTIPEPPSKRTTEPKKTKLFSKFWHTLRTLPIKSKLTFETETCCGLERKAGHLCQEAVWPMNFPEDLSGWPTSLLLPVLLTTCELWARQLADLGPLLGVLFGWPPWNRSFTQASFCYSFSEVLKFWSRV